jgi:CMP-N-acetylneuraminic acid synthetase
MPDLKTNHILAIIPARQGSKSIPHKNIRSVGGKPLMCYSIEHALAATRVTRTIVSTDSAYYADIARVLEPRFLFYGQMLYRKTFLQTWTYSRMLYNG